MKNKDSIKFQVILVSILATICIVYSTIQTAKGYEIAAGSAIRAWVIAIIISIGLITLNHRLWYHLWNRELKKGFIIFFLYCGIALFSFVANFNAFYSDYMEDELLYDDLENLEADLKNLESKININLEKKINLQKIQELKALLLVQILDPGAPGYGPKSRKIVNEIQEELNVELTIPAGSPTLIANSFEKQIDDIISKRTKVYRDFKIRSQAEFGKLYSNIDVAKKSIDNINDDKTVIENCVKTYNSVGEEANGMLDLNQEERFHRLTYENKEIGKIDHSLKAALSSKNAGVSIVPISLSILIDFFTPCLIIILTLTLSTPKGRKLGPSPPVRDSNTSTNTSTSGPAPIRVSSENRSFSAILKSKEKNKK